MTSTSASSGTLAGAGDWDIVASEDIEKLRGNARHCRRLARAFDDQPLIDALHQTASEFDAEADRLEGGEEGAPSAPPPEI